MKKQTKESLSDQLNLPKDFFKKFKDKESFEEFFQQLFKEGVESMLEAELDEHMGYEKHSVKGYHSGNSRNGSSPKTIKTHSMGDIVLNIPRDRNGSFSPQLLPKHKRMSGKLEEMILGLYSRGMTTTDIEDYMEEEFGQSISPTTVSNITNQLLSKVREWQNRPLESVYFAIWLDGIRVKVRHDGKILNKCIYLVIGLTNEGKKEVLGMWIDLTESATFWMKVLNDLKQRGVEDVLIACTDNLTGFTKAIKAIFPNTITQLCIVHQIRNCCKFVSYKERKEFSTDLKTVYKAIDVEQAAHALDTFEQKWGAKYGYAIQSWRNNWSDLTAYFEFPAEIRRIIYTTNIIESLNSGVRKYTKTKTIFPHDDAALKVVYMAVAKVEKKWTLPIRDWGIILQQFLIIFEDRCRL